MICRACPTCTKGWRGAASEYMQKGAQMIVQAILLGLVAMLGNKLCSLYLA